MRPSLLYATTSLLLLLCVSTVTAKNHKNDPATNKSPSFIRALSIPRGGDSAPSFRQQLEQYEKSMKVFLGHYETASVHMKEVLEKTLTFHGKTNNAMNDLEDGLFKVSIQLSMLPTELSTHFKVLHGNMLTLQEAATTMLDQLAVYVELVTRCLQLVEGLVSEVREKSLQLPQIKKQERRLQRNGGSKYTKLQQRVQEDMMYLQETSLSVRDEVLEMDTRGREDVWPTFIENVKAVHEAAVNVDRIFQSIRDGRGSNGLTNSSDVVVSESMPAEEAMNYGLAGDAVQEVEVEMTTYQYSW